MKELNYETRSHYNGEILVKFYPKSHRYQIMGEKDFLIGVTTATGVMDKSTPLIIWATRLSKDYLLDAMSRGEPITEALIEESANQHRIKKEEAATSGSLVHEWAEQYIKGLKPEVPEDPQVRNGVLAFLKWVNGNNVKFTASEQGVLSRKYGYVGTLDAIGTIGDSPALHLIDFKTSGGIYPEMPMQVSAYQQAHSEEFGTIFGDKYIVRFDKNTAEFEVKSFPARDHEDHFNAFLSCLTLKRFSKEWEKTHGYYSKK